ncbi:putative RNA methyltransferase [Paenibacillus campinasensis]|uniref:Methyltransferase domain-containing protein n=1 Tax=Paenibacillus campinasensis TaxID=66347 RepID=A0A268ETI2_9BACL|nr:methyltransferase domain-containing protein [Paenibacillus campinasensis]PAD76420.1 hypothetical protein CHH67_12420 [Paenibacillus campinasensis]
MSQHQHDRLRIRTKALRQHEHLFRCPVCTASMKFAEHSAALVCDNHHSFDVSRHGYINLLAGRSSTKYDKALFQSRKRMNDSGFFQPMLAEIIDVVQELAEERGQLTLLDAGCGEGSHLTAIGRALDGEKPGRCVRAGLDIAKEGVLTAAKSDRDSVWCVGDLAQAPFADQQFDVILNILSPSNYAEFNRLLTAEGLVLKVIPGIGYLKELREMLYPDSGHRRETNDQLLRLFTRHYELVAQRPVQYRYQVGPALMKDLVTMTPLAWGAAEEDIMAVLGQKTADMTVDLMMVCGRRRPG